MTNPAYTTDKKEEKFHYTDENELETYFTITATSAGGTKFHINVPEADLDKADELLKARAVQLDGI